MTTQKKRGRGRPSMSPEERASARIAVRCSPDLLAAAVAAAELEEQDLGDFVREAVEHYARLRLTTDEASEREHCLAVATQARLSPHTLEIAKLLRSERAGLRAENERLRKQAIQDAFERAAQTRTALNLKNAEIARLRKAKK